jgi:hypothetical protein
MPMEFSIRAFRDTVAEYLFTANVRHEELHRAHTFIFLGCYGTTELKRLTIQWA